MIACIKGQLISKSLNSVIIDVSGVGYEIQMATTSISKLPELGSTVQILTRLQIREDSCILFGFLSAEEKNLFERFVAVSGVGPKAALSLLSTCEPKELITAIATQNISVIQQAPGVGKKMASRIALELKDQFSEDDSLAFGSSRQTSFARAGALEALLSMGFTSAEAELALKGAPELSTEASLLQYALKRLGE